LLIVYTMTTGLIAFSTPFDLLTKYRSKSFSFT
jgi:hypothetical protein